MKVFKQYIITEVIQEIMLLMFSNPMHLLWWRCLALSFICCHIRSTWLSAVNQTNK